MTAAVALLSLRFQCHCHAVLGSTNSFDMAPEELDKFSKAHNLNGGSSGGSTEEEDEDDFTESLVYVNSPKASLA